MRKRFTLKSPLIKRNLPTIAAVVMLSTTPLTTQATTIISIRDGAWGNPMTWSCICIPTKADDVFVMHTISMSADYEVHSLTVEATGAINGNDKYSMSIHYDISSSGPAALPIQLLSMDAEIRCENIVLSWSTASEVNNDFFTIERHQNEGRVEVLASLPGAGNANQSVWS